jgi:hypothetical protein
MAEKAPNPEKKKRDWKRTAKWAGAIAVGAVVLL